VQCGELEIKIRVRGKRSSIYMFSTNGKTLAQADLQDESVSRLRRLPEEYSSFLEMKDQRSDSNRSGMASQIGNFHFGLRGLSFKARVVKKSGVRAVTSRDGTALLVCDVTLSDGTGEIPLAVWNSQIGTVSEGDLVQIENASVRGFRGKIQLCLSRKMGALTVLKPA
jgi:ssDNA-binding replication factor A large subunit